MKRFSVPINILKQLWFIFFAILLISLVVVIFVFVRLEDAITMDFVSLLTGASVLREGSGSEIYNLSVQSEHQNKILSPFGIKVGKDVTLLPYLNIPAFALIFIPFLYLPYLIAFKTYVVFLVMGLFLISYLAVKIFKSINFYSVWTFLPFLYYPAIGAAFIGQTSIFLVLVYLAIYFYLKKKKFFTAGVFAALLFIKLQYVISVPFLFLLVANKKDFLRGLLVSSLLLWGVSVLLSAGFWNDYAKLLTVAQNPTYGLLDSKMFTFYATLKQSTNFGHLGFTQLFLFNLIFYALYLLVFVKIHKNFSLDLNYALVIILTLIFCLHGVDYDQSILLIPIYILLNMVLTKKEPQFSVKLGLLTITLSPIFILTGYGIYASVALLMSATVLMFFLKN